MTPSYHGKTITVNTGYSTFKVPSAAFNQLRAYETWLDLRMNDWVVVRVLPGTEVAFSELPEGDMRDQARRLVGKLKRAAFLDKPASPRRVLVTLGQVLAAR